MARRYVLDRQRMWIQPESTEKPEDHAPRTIHHVIPSMTKDKYCCNKSEATEWQEVATKTFYGGIRDPRTVRHRDT